MSAGGAARAVAATAGVAFVAGAMALGVTAARVLAAEREQRDSTAPRPEGDYLLVLGAQVFPHGPSKELQARLDHAVARWHAGAAPLLGVTGGVDGDLDETQVMADYVVSQGVPREAVRLISPGENTRASMRSMAKAAPGARVLAVSSPYHSHRMAAEGRRCGLLVIADCPESTPESDNPDIRRTRLFGETVGSFLYASPESVVSVARRVSVPIRRQLPRRVAAVSQKVRDLRAGN